MPRKILNTLIFALIAVVVAALGYWNLAPDSTRQAQRASDDNVVDFYAVGARTVQFQDDGKLHYRMTADKLEHIKSTDITLIDAPKLELYRGTGTATTQVQVTHKGQVTAVDMTSGTPRLTVGTSNIPLARVLGIAM